MANKVLLLVEDESFILINVEEALSDGGYEVLSATNGVEAIKLLEMHGDSLAGVVTDIRIGKGPDGWEIARQARERQPSVAVVYMTADSSADWTAKGVPLSVLVQKPFAEAQIVTAISQLLIHCDTNLSS